MTSINFILNNVETKIQCDKNEKMKSIFNRFGIKVEKNIKDLHFLYSGKYFDDDLMELSFNEAANEIDKGRNKMKIIVYEMTTKIENNTKTISKEIICPECADSIRINIINYKIKLFDCKNNHLKYLNFEEFKNTQNIDESKIICGNCKEKNKLNSYKNLFYICNYCKMNLCSLCKSHHDESHDIVNYESKNYICELHNEKYISYCKICTKNICSLCLEQHENHNIELYKAINKDEYLEKLKILRKSIDKMNDIIQNIIIKFNLVIKNIEIYYNICENIIINYNNKKRNYQIIENMKNILNNEIIGDIDTIIKNENDRCFKIKEIYNKIIKKNNDHINEQMLIDNLIKQREIQPIIERKVIEPIVQKEIQRGIQPIIIREVEPIIQREIQPITKREVVEPIIQREIQPIIKREVEPIFKREILPITKREVVEPIIQRDILPITKKNS